MATHAEVHSTQGRPGYRVRTMSTSLQTGDQITIFVKVEIYSD